jgi:hypothetical protein
VVRRPGRDVVPDGGTANGDLRLITNYWTDAYFTSAVAYGEAHMDFITAEASQTVTATLRRGDKTIASQSATTADGFILPLVGSLSTFVNIAITGTCGYLVDATTTHSANDTYVGTMVAKDVRTSHKAFAQPDCPPEPAPPTASGGGGGLSSGADEWYLCTFQNYFIGDELISTEVLGCRPLRS